MTASLSNTIAGSTIHVLPEAAPLYLANRYAPPSKQRTRPIAEILVHSNTIWWYFSNN